MNLSGLKKYAGVLLYSVPTSKSSQKQKHETQDHREMYLKTMHGVIYLHKHLLHAQEVFQHSEKSFKLSSTW